MSTLFLLMGNLLGARWGLNAATCLEAERVVGLGAKENNIVVYDTAPQRGH